MERRKFIKQGCSLCAGFASLGIVTSLLEGCTPGALVFKTSAAEGKISVPIEKFLSDKFVIVRDSQLEYDLLVVKESDHSYHTLAMQCTHRDQPLIFTSTGLTCNEHGSRFDLSGNVLRDPATKPLRKFKSELINSSVVVYLS